MHFCPLAEPQGSQDTEDLQGIARAVKTAGGADHVDERFDPPRDPPAADIQQYGEHGERPSSSLILCGIPVIRNNTPTTNVNMGTVMTWACVTCTNLGILSGLISTVRTPDVSRVIWGFAVTITNLYSGSLVAVAAYGISSMSPPSALWHSMQ